MKHLDPTNISLRDVSEIANAIYYSPKIYLLHLILGQNRTHVTYAFGSRIDRIEFESQLNSKYKGEIHLLSRDEVIYNPRAVEIVENLNERIK